MKKAVIISAVLFGLAIGIYLFTAGPLSQESPPPPTTVNINGQTQTYSWKILADMPTPRTEVTAAVVDGKIYVIGGFDRSGRTLNTVEIYDPQMNAWQVGPSLPDGRHHAAVVSLGQTLYVIGGFGGAAAEPQADVFSLSAGQNSWSRATAMPTARGALAAATDGQKIFAIGGVGRDGLTNALEIYDAANSTWSVGSPATIKRDHLAAGWIQGQLYVAGGRENSLSANLAALEIYDPAANFWDRGSDMPTARGGIAAAVLDDLLIVVGGEKPSSTFSEVEAFSVATHSWAELPPLPTARHGLAAVTIGRSVFAIGGGKQPGLSVSGSTEVLTIQE